MSREGLSCLIEGGRVQRAIESKYGDCRYGIEVQRIIEEGVWKWILIEESR